MPVLRADISKFRGLPRPVLHVRGDTETLEDPWAVARRHPKVAAIKTGAYLGALLTNRANEAFELANIEKPISEQKEKLKVAVKTLLAAARVLNRDHVRDRLERSLDQAPIDNKPAVLCDWWMDALPQIRTVVDYMAGRRGVEAAVVRRALDKIRRGEVQIELYWGSPTLRVPTSAAEVLNFDGLNERAIATIAKFCGLVKLSDSKPITLREAAFALTAKLTGAHSETPIRHSRDRATKRAVTSRTKEREEYIRAACKCLEKQLSA
jgi:hypothetical protein